MDAKDIAEDLQDTSVVDELDALAEGDSQPEKMLPASRVDELIKKAKYKGRRSMQDQLDLANQQIEQLKAQAAQAAQASPGQQSLPGDLQEQVVAILQKQMQEERDRLYQEQLDRESNEIAQNYFGKLAQGKELYEDFEAVTSGFDATAFPQLVYLATQADNTAAIIYDLQKNPAKLAQLAVLVDKSPSMARAEIAKLSQSIKANEEAKRTASQAQDPLSRLKPSTVGTDNGAKSVRDFKSSPRLRG